MLQHLAEHYWSSAAQDSIGTSPLLGAISQYTGTRLIHDLFADDHRPTFRYFGGYVRYVSPHLRLTNHQSDPRPAVMLFPDSSQAPLLQWTVTVPRDLRALWTLERYLGWPTMQQILARLAERVSTSGVTVAALAEATAAVTGRDLGWFFAGAFDATKSYDYATRRLDTAAADSTTIRSTVVIERRGDALFSGMPQAAPPDRGGALQVAVRFSDGSTLHETWDGRAREREFTYEGAVAVVAAVVDPQRTFLLDSQPFNDAIRVDAIDQSIPRRWALQWVSWVQDAVLLMAAVL